MKIERPDWVVNSLDVNKTKNTNNEDLLSDNFNQSRYISIIQYPFIYITIFYIK